jgi:signal transduction histidine kinase
MKNDALTFQPRVLVIDDEKRIRDACHKMLTQRGFDVARAESGDEGLERIEKEHFDLILLDLMMPGLSGIDVLERVRDLHPDTAVIVITGYATLEHSIEAMKKGAFDFIPKPFGPQELNIVVDKALTHIRTLQDIAHEKSRMRSLINHLAGGVLATDADRKVALANPAFLRMVAWKGGDPTGLPAAEVVSYPALIEMIDKVLSLSRDEFAELNEEIETGEAVYGVRCVPFRDRAGRNLGSLTVLRDITVAKKMDRLKSEFVSMVSHEIRSPMNSVLMQLKVVLDGLAGDLTPKQKEILDRSSLRLKSLVDLSTELLDLARIESGRFTQEKENLAVAGLLADQVNLHTPKALAKNITLELEPHGAFPPLLANLRNMEEVLSNLITNAIHYTPEGGRVAVGARVDGGYLKIHVTDTGFGIAPEDREKIFERFYRVKNEKTRYVTGTGLGLPIVKSIVESHNGRIQLESEVDKGTTFYVILPLIGH